MEKSLILLSRHKRNSLFSKILYTLSIIFALFFIVRTILNPDPGRWYTTRWANIVFLVLLLLIDYLYLTDTLNPKLKVTQDGISIGYIIFKQNFTWDQIEFIGALEIIRGEGIFGIRLKEHSWFRKNIPLTDFAEEWHTSKLRKTLKATVPELVVEGSQHLKNNSGMLKELFHGSFTLIFGAALLLSSLGVLPINLTWSWNKWLTGFGGVWLLIVGFSELVDFLIQHRRGSAK